MSDLAGSAAGAVFFDLDGTLVDTAPDMVAVLQALQRSRGLQPVSYEFGRSHVSNGALGLLRIAFPEVDGDEKKALHAEYLERYAEALCVHSGLFAGLDELLARLEAGGVKWGVVTNKPAYLTDPLLDQLALAARSICTISGDTLPVRKPHPEPLLHACAIAGVRPEDSVYVGDASRDIEAGLAAGMNTVAAAYGYIVDGDDPEAWGAHDVARNTRELAQIVLKAVNLDT
ncbi:MAG TPA: HAD-IA family hydrolase [Woeseiaceae bacterium]|nr:HAD-IA family hydrolase [Woeseiaceae bacterium]